MMVMRLCICWIVKRYGNEICLVFGAQPTLLDRKVDRDGEIDGHVFGLWDDVVCLFCFILFYFV